MAHDNPVFLVFPSEFSDSAEPDRITGKTLNLMAEPAESSNITINEKSEKMGCCDWKWSWLVNGFVIGSFTALIIIFEYNIIPFRPLGFRCKDPNLSYKFTGDTIPFGYLMAVSIIVPLIAIVLVELFVINSYQAYVSSEKKRTLKQAWSWFVQFFIGLLILLFLIQFVKGVVLEPRPHFFDTCKPDRAVNCNSGYISEYTCTNKNVSERDVRDSYRSFPSGHSAVGIYTASFMIWFLQIRVPPSDYLLVPWFQCLFLLWGFLCSLTRITDHRHHWWDVLAGSMFGLTMAAFAVKLFCESFRCKHTKPRKPDKNLNDTGNNVNHTWNRKFLSSSSNSNQIEDDGELREVK